MFTLRQLKLGVPLVLALGAYAPLASAQGANPPTPDETRDANLRAYTTLLRSDLRAQTTAIVAGVMQFSEAEDAAFWPIYREWEVELAKINDDRLAGIKEYAANYNTLTDAVADRLAQAALELEGRRQALKVKYYDRLKSALSPKTAARFFQVENQILLLLDLQIASSLPIVK